MRATLRILKWLLALVVVSLSAAFGWLWQSPPDLFRVGTAYSAKIVCSNVFIAGRDPGEVLAVDVQAPGHWLLNYISVDVDRERGRVSATLFGALAPSVAVARPGLGCTSVPDGRPDSLMRAELPGRAAPSKTLPWPAGNLVQASTNAALDGILGDEALTGPGMRAVVVVKDGRIVGERYGQGFTEDMPLLGWSMTKTVTAAIIGTLVKAGKMKLDAEGLLGEWSDDGRKAIRTSDLMAMSSGLSFNEDYGDVTDVTRMLFLEPDMAAFAASKPLTGGIGQVWSYSSGTTVILSRLWQAAAGTDALNWPRQALFSPLGMTSAVFETDESGTFVGSSYLYATARDWARFGLFLMKDGVWNGQEILPQGFVGWMREAAPASNGEYGRGQLWRRGPGGFWIGADGAPTLPNDTYWLIGHDGQTVAVIPSRQLVVVRMGLTPSKLGYRPQELVAAVVRALD